MIPSITKIPKFLLLGTLLSRIAMFMSVPFLAIYLTNALSFSVVQVGYIIGIQPLITVITSLYISPWTNRISLKRLLFVTPLVWGLSLIAFTFTANFWILLFLNGFTGFCYAIYEPNTKYLLSITAYKENKLLLFNLRYAAINIGAFIGPLLGMLFNVKNGLTAYVWSGTVYILVSIANLFVIDADSSKNEHRLERQLQHRPHLHSLKPLISLLIGVGFSYFGYSQFNSTVAQYFATNEKFTNGVQLYSLTLSISPLFLLLFQFLLLRITKNASPYLILIISNILLAGSLFLVIYSYFFPIWLVMIITYSLGELLLGSHLDYTVDQLAPTEQKTLYFSWTECIKLGSTLGPIVGSYLISTGNYPYAFIMLAAITLIGSFSIFLVTH